MTSRPVDPDALAEAAAVGMGLAYHASQAPDRAAVTTAGYGNRTLGELNANVNRLARALRGVGVGPGVGVALLARNRPEFIETYQACLRIGARLTPINWHLTPPEVAYIVDNCEAHVLVADVAFSSAARHAADLASGLRESLAVGGTIDGFDDYDSAIAAEDSSDLEDPVIGSSMLYTSGTTGQPKGVYRQPSAELSALYVVCKRTAEFKPETDVSMITGPLYHAAPLGLNYSLTFGAGLGQVLMDKWDAEETLRLIDRYRVTHTHMVATMFHRLLALPDEIKSKYDLSSLRWLIHGAAPCPVHIKQAMIDWLGPVVYEYYAATEGGSYFVDSTDWVERPGTVGQIVEGGASKILDDDGNEVPRGQIGTIYFIAPENRFEYFKAPEKTASAYHGDYFTMGDMGYEDPDGWLFLTGRSAELIISGGVNIYPQEVDDVISQHPAVFEVCTIGVPSDEWGESVKSIVELRDGWEPNEDTATAILEYARTNLPSYKRPRSIEFGTNLPRLPTGKIQRHKVRAPFWEGRERSI